MPLPHTQSLCANLHRGIPQKSFPLQIENTIRFQKKADLRITDISNQYAYFAKIVKANTRLAFTLQSLRKIYFVTIMVFVTREPPAITE